EVLELDHHPGENVLRRANEFVDERLVFSAAQAMLAQSDVIGILQQFLIVRTDIEHYRQAQLGMHAGTSRIKREVSNGDPHAVGSQVTQAQDSLAVGHHNEFCRVWPIPQYLGDPATIVGADEESARSLENMAKPLASKPNRGRVNKRLHFVDVVTHH